MSDVKQLVSQLYIKVDGQDPPAELGLDLEAIEVESSLHLPDVATLIFNDPKLKWVDDALFEPGKALIVEAKGTQGREKLFDGEIVEIEPEYGQATNRLVVRAFDRMHRLARGTFARTFLNVNDGDLVKKIAGEAGLTAKAGPTPQVHEFVMQANETNLAFLQRRAAALGFIMYVDAKTLHFEPLKSGEAEVQLEWKKDLTEFRPRLTTIGQVTEVKVRGWDPEQKREVMGQSKVPKVTPENGVSPIGGKYAQKAFRMEAPYLVANGAIRNQDHAEKVAQAYVDRFAGQFIVAEGVCGGEPKVIAGVSIKVRSVGERFSGTYFVTSARHVYNQVEGYFTQFTISGLQPSTLLSMLVPEEPATAADLGVGLMIGIVTDNNDPKNQGRVKVKLPALTVEHTTDWARVVAVGAGPKRGIMWLPEVNDEVLVGFEQGDINNPFVIGGLWNGKDAPPLQTSEALKGGQVVKRVLQSRTGHKITLDDDESSGGITIEDKSKNKIVLKASDGSVTIQFQGDGTIKSDKNITIEAQGDLTLKATGKAKVEGSAGVDVGNGSSMVNVKGSVINLN